MEISLKTKLSMAATLATGAVCTYFAPHLWVTGFMIGVAYSQFQEKKDEELKKVYSNEGSFRFYVLHQIKGSISPLTTAGLNILSSYLLISKVALPIIFIYASMPITIASGLFAGYALNRYFILDHFERWARNSDDDRAKNVAQSLIV